jgi:hypothetical protein
MISSHDGRWILRATSSPFSRRIALYTLRPHEESMCEKFVEIMQNQLRRVQFVLCTYLVQYSPPQLVHSPRVQRHPRTCQSPVPVPPCERPVHCGSGAHHPAAFAIPANTRTAVGQVRSGQVGSTRLASACPPLMMAGPRFEMAPVSCFARLRRFSLLRPAK